MVWTLWASIQDGVSDIDFDFWSWGMEKYERAVAEFDDAGFERLLETIEARYAKVVDLGDGADVPLGELGALAERLGRTGHTDILLLK